MKFALEAQRGEGDVFFSDIKLKENDGKFAAKLEGFLWSGSCGSTKVSCAAVLVYDQDGDTEDLDPVRGYIFDYNKTGGCTAIFDKIKVFLDSEF